MDILRPDQRAHSVFPVEITWAGQEEPVRVGKLLCIGRNYAKHAAEMKSEVPEEPIVFLKPSSAIIRSGGRIVLPPQAQSVHYEVELVAVVGRGGRNISEADARSHIAGYAVGLDITARDIQQQAKRNGHPWSVAKGFDSFAPLGEVVPADEVDDPHHLEIALSVNREIKQSANTSDMVFSVDELVAYCSTIFTLHPGDLIYTGTPDGVGPLTHGDRLVAQVEDWIELEVEAVRYEPE